MVATIICPACGYAKRIDASKFHNSSNILKAKCKCGKTFKCSIDFRKTYRRTVNLAGEYIIMNNKKRGDMMVEDLSMGGVGFTNMTPHQMETGDILELKFKLDDANRTEIVRKVKIMIIKGQSVGTEFMEKNRYDTELGFYLKV